MRGYREFSAVSNRLFLTRRFDLRSMLTAVARRFVASGWQAGSRRYNAGPGCRPRPSRVNMTRGKVGGIVVHFGRDFLTRNDHVVIGIDLVAAATFTAVAPGFTRVFAAQRANIDQAGGIVAMEAPTGET